ncbi:hypothetical protein F7725_003511 [Dissostichus mawsoni]|uniref:Uncharacterized protein n=1 Tax=Dissostichus mawsoni TaxID=36200 RepID=A0A7J5YBE6_DISMA|nr:hypothetical protein F7725_003511 [Dissostichus mawsoni]
MCLMCFSCNFRHEVLQFCWLSPDKRATAEEVHRLLIYLRMQGQKDIEEDFDQRWDALKPNPIARQNTISHSSYPILDQFADDALRQEIDEVLTVTETSKGLSFEYVWEAAKHDHYEGNHGRSGLDTTLNYHSMFFPVSTEDIQAHFPDRGARAAAIESGDTPSGIPGIVPVFDAQKPSNGNEYYIQLEEQGESTVEEDGNRGQDMDFSSGHVRLDESSTDADFFHQSIDSKDSYLPDSHIWSSLENDSPYHTNIFTDGGSKQEDSPSWRQGFMELPERNGNPFRDVAPLVVQEVDTDKSYGDYFLGDSSEALHPTDSVEAERKSTGVNRLLNTEKLADNFMFLKDQHLMKDRLSPQDNFLFPGHTHEPEERFKMRSWDNMENLGSLIPADTYLQPAASSTSSRQESLDSSKTSLGESCPSPVVNEKLVPFITVVTEDKQATSCQLVIVLPQKPSVHCNPQSEMFEGIVSQTDDHTLAFSESATTDSLCTDAKIPSLEDDLGTSEDNVHPIVNQMPDDMQISQDSLLEDSMSTTLPTVDNSAETPDSLDSLDIHRLGEQGEELSAQTAQHKLQPPYKISDSGYETENLESPEWNSQPNVMDQSPVKNGTSVAKEEEENEELAAAGALVPPEIIISEVEGVLEPHREDPIEGEQQDEVAPAVEPVMASNYRDSAYFSDNESEPEKKSEEAAAGGSRQATWLRNSTEEASGVHGGPALEVSVEQDVSSLFSQQETSQAQANGETPALHGILPDSETTEKCKGATNSHNEDEKKQDLFKDGTSLDQPSDDLEASSPLPPVPPSKPVQETSGHAKLTRTYASDSHKIKEPDMEGRFLGRRDGSDGQEDGGEADEEDENSDDSDDDVRGYQLHSSSSESEDETVHTVPFIVSDDSRAKNLKSLLKPTTLNIGASSSPSSRVQQPMPSASYLNRFANSESSTDEEGGGFEWDDDFSLAPAFPPKTDNDPMTNDAVCGSNRGCFSQPELLFTYMETAMRTMTRHITHTSQLQSEPHHPSSYISCNSRKKMFLNVCFKDSSSTFLVFGCFILLCVESALIIQNFASPKKKKSTLCSEFNTLGCKRITTAK